MQQYNNSIDRVERQLKKIFFLPTIQSTTNLEECSSRIFFHVRKELLSILKFQLESEGGEEVRRNDVKKILLLRL